MMINYLRIDNLVLNKPNFLFFQCKFHMVVVDHHPVELHRVKYKHVHTNEDNHISVLRRMAEGREN